MCWKAVVMYFRDAIGRYHKPDGVAVAPAPAPTPTPTPSAPVITQTSTPGAAPFQWSWADDPSVHAGDYVDVQRATGTSTADATVNLLAGTLNGEAIQQLTVTDLADPSAMVLTDLTATPAGPLALRLRFGHEDGLGGYIWGLWSNVVTDTIAASFNSTFNAANRTTFGGQTGTISNAGLTYAGYDFGSDVTFRCATNTPLSNAIGVVEFTPGAGVASTTCAIGFVNGAYDYSGAGSNLGANSNSFGLRVDVGGVAGVYAGGSLIATPPLLVSGSTYILIVHKATGKVWVRYPGGTYYPDTPSFNADGSIASGAGYASGMTSFQWVVCSLRGQPFTVNAGQGAFSQSLPANAPAGWA